VSGDLREWAWKYFMDGFNVVAMLGKKPLTAWSEWINRRQTHEEFEAQPWYEADGFAIVCSWPNNDGLYLAVVDWDTKNLPPDVVKRGRELLRNFPVTRIEETPSGGLHYIYLSEKEPRPVAEYHGKCALELIAGAKLCIMAPSKGYRRLNESPISIKPNVEALFLSRIGDHSGAAAAALSNTQTAVDPHLEQKLQAIINSGRLRVEGLGGNYILAHCPRHPPDLHPSFAIHRYKYYAVDYHDGSVYNLNELAELLGVDLPRREEPRDGERGKEGGGSRHVLSKVVDGAVIEAIGELDGAREWRPKLLIYRDGGFSVAEDFAVDGVEFKPRSPRSYPYEPYQFFDGPTPSRLELIDKVKAEIDTFIDAPEHDKAILTASVVLSYCQEQFEALPYIYLVGDNESGKSHCLNLLAELCYRPLAGVSHTAADIFSYLEDDGLPLTIIEDEFQGSDRDDEKMKIYKAGYKRGARVARISLYEGGRRVDYFNTYGLKVMSAERLIENRGLMQRCIVIEMVEGYPEKDYYDQADHERFSRLRSELLKWRMRLLAGHEKLPGVEIELRGRARELYTPLLTVLGGHSLFYILEDYIKRLEVDKLAEKQQSLEGLLTKVVAELLCNREDNEIEFSEIWWALKNELGVEENQRGNLDSPYLGEISRKTVARRLREIFGAKRREAHQNGRHIYLYIFDRERVEKMARKYGYNLQTTIAA